jgi:hypothetical protein
VSLAVRNAIAQICGQSGAHCSLRPRQICSHADLPVMIALELALAIRTELKPLAQPAQIIPQ